MKKLILICFYTLMMLLAIVDSQPAEISVQQTANIDSDSGFEEYFIDDTLVTDIVCSSDDPEAIQVYGQGQVLQEEGDLEGAKELYHQAIELDPGYCDAMDNLGLIYRREGDPEEAAEWYRKSIAIAPENIVAHQNLAVALNVMGDIEGSIKEYEFLIDLDSTNPEGYYGLGHIYLLQGNPEEAIEFLGQAEELYLSQTSPWAMDTRYLLGFAYYDAGDCQLALTYFENVYQEFIFDPDINLYMGACYLSEGMMNDEKAGLYIDRALFLGGDIPEDLLALLGDRSIRVTNDIVVASSYFGLTFSDQGEEFFFPTDYVPCDEGQGYGWFMILDTELPSIKLREEFEIPQSPTTWGELGEDRTISEDG